MTTPPLLSVIMPAHQAASLLPETLGALRRSTLEATRWELIVVDDGSTDSTAAVARTSADRMLGWPAPPRGPGAARNAGAAAARGEWLVFVDADVRVHPETLQRFADAITRHHHATAIFGTYDATPAAAGLVSRYRNLLHRYKHLRGAGAAETFWAGLGGVRRDRFRAIGGFDAVRFPRPAIEDIDLGYRLREAGDEIVLDPAIEATHLKRWTLWSMVRTDFQQRALPWMRLLLEQPGRANASLNVSRGDRIRVALGGLSLVATPLGLTLGVPAAWWLSPLLLGAAVLGSTRLLTWLAREQGLGLAAAAVPLQAWYYCSNAVAAGLGIITHLLRTVTAPRQRPA